MEKKPKCGAGPKFFYALHFFAYLNHLHTQNNIVSNYFSNWKCFLSSVLHPFNLQCDNYHAKHTNILSQQQNQSSSTWIMA